MTYTSSFAESLGIASSTAAFMLTVYNVGCFVGSVYGICCNLKKSKGADSIAGQSCWWCCSNYSDAF